VAAVTIAGEKRCSACSVTKTHLGVGTALRAANARVWCAAIVTIAGE
jgi:hypothetical protein